MVKFPLFHFASRLPGQFAAHVRGLLKWPRLRLRPTVPYVFLCVFVFVCVVAFVLFFFAHPAGDNDRDFFINLPVEKSGIFFLGHIYNFNVPLATISVSWLIGACGDYRSTAPLQLPFQSTSCAPSNIPLSVYVNGASQPIFTYNPAAQPYLASDRKTQLYVQALNEFQTTHLLDVNTHNLMLGKTFRSSDQLGYLYPFDEFRLETNFVVTSHNITSLPILAIAFTGYTDNFVPFVKNTASTTLLNGTAVDSRYAVLTLIRSGLAKVFVMTLFAVNWALTAIVIYITTIALFSTESRITDGIVALPITVIVTLPALRALFLTSPPFGILIDIIGLFLQMMLVSICSFILLFMTSLRSNEQVGDDRSA